eukprot:1885852-Rhodomonas_salina.1
MGVGLCGDFDHTSHRMRSSALPHPSHPSHKTSAALLAGSLHRTPAMRDSRGIPARPRRHGHSLPR